MPSKVAGTCRATWRVGGGRGAVLHRLPERRRWRAAGYEVWISGATAEKASVAASWNEATITSSARPNSRSSSASGCLVGRHCGRRLLDVEVEKHPAELLQHLAQGGDPQRRLEHGPAPVDVVTRRAARAPRPRREPTSRRCPAPPAGPWSASAMAPRPSVVRSTVASWHTTSWPSAVAWTSSSRASAPARHRLLQGQQGARRRLAGAPLVGVVEDPPLQPGVDHVPSNLPP